jgi:hypothetical protein
MSCSISSTVTLCSSQVADQRLEVFGFLGVQAGGRFVEHEIRGWVIMQRAISRRRCWP